MTLAERDRINQIIKAMSIEQQEQVLKNIDPRLIENEKSRRMQKLLDEINQFAEIWNKYQVIGWDWVTLTDLENELRSIQFMK